MTTRLWRRPCDTAESRALEAINDLLDSYVNVLVDTEARTAAPLYMCLLRDHLLRATLRRYVLALSPALGAAQVEGVARECSALQAAKDEQVRLALLARHHVQASPCCAVCG